MGQLSKIFGHFEAVLWGSRTSKFFFLVRQVGGRGLGLSDGELKPSCPPLWGCHWTVLTVSSYFWVSSFLTTNGHHPRVLFNRNSETRGTFGSVSRFGLHDLEDLVPRGKLVRSNSKLPVITKRSNFWVFFCVFVLCENSNFWRGHPVQRANTFKRNKSMNSYCSCRVPSLPWFAGVPRMGGRETHQAPYGWLSHLYHVWPTVKGGLFQL